MKKCRECEETKPLEDFYKNSGMFDGYLNKCKECVITQNKNYRKENEEKVKKYDRNRPNAKERVKKMKEYNSDPERIKKNSKLKIQWAKKNRNKVNAHQKVKRAINNGTLIKPLVCSECNNKDNIQAHHEDYNKPLLVIWLCASCHSNIHKKD